MFGRFLFQRSSSRLFVSNRALQRTTFSTTISRNAYVRFGGEPNKPPAPLIDVRSWNPRTQVATAIVLFGGMYYVSHLEQVPETGRWRFMNTSPAAEAKFGEMLRLSMRSELKQSTLPSDHLLTRHVHKVVNRLLHASNLGTIRGEGTAQEPSPVGLGTDAEGLSWNPDMDVGAAKDPGPSYGPKKEWDVIVVNDMKVVNAMANPGLVVIFTGILPVCQNEEGLAAVLGHEIGHVVARHPAERMSATTVLLVAQAALSLFGLDAWMSQLISKFVLELPNSRTQELEADLIGLRLMSRACYDPAASPQMFSRLAKVEAKFGGRVKFDLLQTHPSSESRIKHLEERLSEGYAIMESNPDCELVRRQLDSFRRSFHDVNDVKFTNSGFETV